MIPNYTQPNLPVPTTAAEFRAVATLFRDPVMFPDEEIEFWITVARLMLTCRWGNLLGAGVYLFVSHNLALYAMMQKGLEAGGIPGFGARGLISSESAGAVSISYNSSQAAEADAGHWDYTIFGQQFIRLARIIGAGPIQLNVPPFSGLCGGCGCYGMMDPLSAGQMGGFGPGWRQNPNSNVPVGKFIPTRVSTQWAMPPQNFVFDRENPNAPGDYRYSEGDVLTNPETGEQVQLRGDKWVFLG